MKKKGIVFVLLLGCSVGAEELVIRSFDATGALTFNEITNATVYDLPLTTARRGHPGASGFLIATSRLPTMPRCLHDHLPQPHTTAMTLRFLVP